MKMAIGEKNLMNHEKDGNSKDNLDKRSKILIEEKDYYAAKFLTTHQSLIESTSGLNKENVKLEEYDEFLNMLREISNTKEPTQELLNRILQLSDSVQKEALFEILICKKYHLVKIIGDGNCLFASIERGLIKENPYSLYIIYEYLRKYPQDFKNLRQMHFHSYLRIIAAHYIVRHPIKFHNFISDDEIIKPHEELTKLMKIMVNFLIQIDVF